MNHTGAPDNQIHKDDKPLRVFDLEIMDGYGAGRSESVTAHMIVFDEGYTQFWERRPDDQPDFLVLAVRSADVAELRELRPCEPEDPAEVVKPVKRSAEVAEGLLALDSGD